MVKHVRMLDDILERLGGDGEVAAFMRITAPAISNWKSRGIPKGRWVDLIRMAEAKAVPLELSDVEAAHLAIKTGPVVQSQGGEAA